MTNQEIQEIVLKQLAIDYHCQPEDFLREGVIFTEAKKCEGRREMPFFEPRLEVVTFGRSAIVNVSKDIMPQIQEAFAGKTRYEILTSPLVYGVNPYFLPDVDRLKTVDCPPFSFELIEHDIQAYYQYTGLDNALQYDENSKRPEVLAAAAYDKERLAGIACASADSKTMWQIGVDVLPEYRGMGIAVKLVQMLTKETLNRGVVPYYTTDCSNIASQRVAVKAGYVPAWAHCFKKRLEGVS